MTAFGFGLAAIIMWIGAAIVANATFSDRSQFGAWVFLFGLIMMIGAVAEAVLR